MILKKMLLDNTGKDISEKLKKINYNLITYLKNDNDKSISELISGNIQEFEDENIINTKEYLLANCFELIKVNLPKCINVGNNAFYNCTALENVNLPECINVGPFAFYNCEKLQNVNIPKCTIIKGSAFQYCNFKKIDLNFVEKIESSAFYNCTALECVKISNTETMCVLADTSAFHGTLIASGNGYIYVPDKLIEQYKTATNWSVYASQIKPLSEYVESEE